MGRVATGFAVVGYPRMVDVCVVGGDDGCLLGGSESVWGGIIFTFILARLVDQGPGSF